MHCKIQFDPQKESVLRHPTWMDLNSLCSVKGTIPKTTFHQYEVSNMSKTTEVVRTVSARDWGMGSESDTWVWSFLLGW